MSEIRQASQWFAALPMPGMSQDVHRRSCAVVWRNDGGGRKGSAGCDRHCDLVSPTQTLQGNNLARVRRDARRLLDHELTASTTRTRRCPPQQTVCPDRPIAWSLIAIGHNPSCCPRKPVDLTTRRMDVFETGSTLSRRVVRSPTRYSGADRLDFRSGSA